MKLSSELKESLKNQQSQIIHEIALEAAKITFTHKNTPPHGEEFGSAHLLDEPDIVAGTLFHEYLIASNGLHRDWKESMKDAEA